MSEDPIGFKGKDYNVYRYVLSNAINLVDPSGLKTKWCVDGGGAVPHHYLCVDGACGGQGPSDHESSVGDKLFGTQPGVNQGGLGEPTLIGANPFGGTSCDDVTPPENVDSQCLDKCVMKKLMGSRPDYSVFGKGTNCIGWNKDAIQGCMKKCLK